MIEGGADLDLALEAFAKDGVSPQLRERNLQRDLATGIGVSGFEHRRHPAATDDLEYGEAPVDDVAGLWLGGAQRRDFEAGSGGQFTT